MMNNQVIKIYQYVYYKYLNEEKKKIPRYGAGINQLE